METWSAAGAGGVHDAARLEAAIAVLRRRAPGTGLPEAELAARERELGRAIPWPARRLLAAVSKQGWEAFVDSILLLQPQECEFTESLDTEDEHGGIGVTANGPFFMFASGVYGDGIVLDAGGRVLLADHEDKLKVIGESLAAWIERLVAFDGFEYAYVTGGLPEVSSERRRNFLIDHLRLNPDSEWAARGLMALDFPRGHPAGYHVWDRAARRLMPAAEAPPTPHVQISDVTQRDVDTVVDVKGCVHLMLIGQAGDASLGANPIDLRPLCRMTTLKDLSVYTIADVDARQLADHPSLVDLGFLRCRVTHIESLALVSTLVRVWLSDCSTDAADVAAFRTRRPGVLVE